MFLCVGFCICICKKKKKKKGCCRAYHRLALCYFIMYISIHLP